MYMFQILRRADETDPLIITCNAPAGYTSQVRLLFSLGTAVRSTAGIRVPQAVYIPPLLLIITSAM